MLPTLHTTFAAWLLLAASCALAPVYGQTAKLNARYGVEGFSQPARLSKVAGKTSGTLASRDVREGEQVTAGTILATLDRTLHEHRLELARLAMESQGEMQGVLVERHVRELRFNAVTNLAERGHATEVELQQAEADFLTAKANVIRVEERQAQLKADYDRYLAEYEQCLIRAPFDGVVIDFLRETGEYVGPGEPFVCTIAQLTTLSVEFLVPRSFREALQLNQTVSVLFVDNDVSVDGVITYISPIPNGETNTYLMKVQVDNQDGKLSAGERCLLGLDGVAESGRNYVGR
jgi:RND family efflux transporter MFP subunit